MVFDLSQLRRDPDFTAPNLFAYDASDRLLHETAAELLNDSRPGELTIIGDRHGALTLGAALGHQLARIRVHQDPLLGERALAQNAARLGGATAYTQHPLDESLLAGATLVLVQLPRSLDALREVADAIARWAHPEVAVLAAGRVKHMTLSMNTVLDEYFGQITASRAQQKSRVLTAKQPRINLDDPPFPRWARDPELSFALASYGATFGGPTLDHGTRLLLRDLAGASPGAEQIVDLGCGNGVLATQVALSRPRASVIATDQSRAAVQATELTVHAAGVADRVSIDRADALETVPDGWADLIVLNPPFHTGAVVHQGVAHRLIERCARALRPATEHTPGGELRIVFNSHLNYRPLIERCIGPARQIARNRTFTVLSAELT